MRLVTCSVCYYQTGDGGFCDRANNRIEARSITAASGYPDAADFAHCTVMVNALLVTEPEEEVAVMVAEPVLVLLAVAKPCESIVTTFWLLVFQVTELVMVLLLPSANVPVAVN